MAIRKTLSFALIALLFGACAAPGSTPDARHSKSLDIVRSDLDVGDAPGRSINPDDARNYIGRLQTVCGVVASADYDARSSERPTVLSFDEPYSNRVFRVVIRGADIGKFEAPETLKGKRVCVSGVIEEDNGAPRIVLRQADQLAEELD